MDYGFTVRSVSGVEETLVLLRSALIAQGFELVGESDLRTAVREKVGEEIGPWVLVNVCHPDLAFQVLGVDRAMSVLVTSGIVVRAGKDATMVEALDPQVLLGLAEDMRLDPIGVEAGRRLRVALRQLPRP
ncbi:DUF302 domain-containing protein [Saccharomonospora sp. NPDC006951]